MKNAEREPEMGTPKPGEGGGSRWLSVPPTLALTWLCLFWLCSAAIGQISPGPLSAVHQQLEGVAKCTSCHDFGAGIRRFKCAGCHTEIQQRLQSQTGFHPRAIKTSPGQGDCAQCHMEHNGRNFALTRLDRKAFDHARDTGFTLEGRHREQKCESCHTSKKIPAAARLEIKLKNIDKSFLGLRRECASCHEDRHSSQLGADCAHCHTQVSWDKAPGFSHSRTSFPLTGLHQPLACQKCHVAMPREGETDKPVLFKGIAYAGCQSCHTDPHKGAFQAAKFRGSCESCHNTSGWKNNSPAHFVIA